MASPFQQYLLCINTQRKTITRYVHHRGTWGVRHLITVVPEPAEALDELGTPAARAMLEEFRANGDVT